MKKALALIITMALIFSFSACKKEEKQATTYQVKGTVSAVSDGKLTISTSAKQSLTFDVSGAKIAISKSTIEVNDVVTLTYTGALNGDDTSKCVVSLVDDSGPDYKTISGTLVSGDSSYLTIKIQDNSLLTFSIIGAELHYKNGIKTGNTIYIKYIGEINKTDTSKVKVCSVTDNNDNPTPAPSVKITAVNETVWASEDVNIRESPDVSSAKLGSLDKSKSITRTGKCDNGWSRVSFAGRDAYIYSDYLTTKNPTPSTKTHTMIGKLVEGTTESLTITDATTGTNYTFNIKGAEMHIVNGVVIGNVISIEYTGEIKGTDTSAVKVTKVSDQDPNTQIIYGMVTAMIDNTSVTITDDIDSKSLSFSLEGAVIECSEGIIADERIAIEYSGSINGTDTSGVKVIKVSDAPLISTMK